ncbi:membrane protein [Rhodococcus rhodnii]|uniref:UPF0182 protein DW322_10860 n=2 Tax=Rhodococcus rhodnii TaxID=38312 RepID=A0A6P2CIE9_9NOCA|nr:membrane protein [Rhodococcus rhodnii]
MRPPASIPSLSRRNRVFAGIGAVLLVLLLLGPRLITTYTDWLWFGETGFRGVFTTVLLSRVVLFLVVGVVVGLIVWVGLLLAYRSRPVFVPTVGPNDPVARYRTTVTGRLRLFGIGIPAVVGVLSGLVAQSNWVTVQMFLNGGEFGTTDPQFGLDVGFYAFDLPFYRFVLNWLFVAVVLAFIGNLITQYIFGGIRFGGGASGSSISNAARIQLAILAGVFVLLKAVAYWLDRYELLSSSRKEPTFTGLSYTDANAVLPAKLILLAIAVVCAIAFFAAIFLRDLRIPAMATALLVLSSVLVGAAWPLVVEQFSVRPNAADKESPYIQRNIEATRAAYGITDDDVTYEDYPGFSTQAPRDIPADQTTIENARLLDPNLLSPTFTQQQQLKNFYGFPQSLDIDRYEIDGETRDYVVAARELSPRSLTGNQTDWINRHTVYTHGNGFISAQANQVNAAASDSAEEAANSNSGYPVYNVSDIASQQSDQDQLIEVDQPRIYYGEVIADTDADYAIVGSAEGEGPREYETDTSQYTYTGEGGVPIGNWFNRLAFAAKYTERNILFSSAIGENSKLIFDRDPRDRVTKVAPWLTADGNTYPAVIDGRIQWIVDAYTTLDNYPYAQRSSLDGLLEDSIDQTTGRPLPRKEVSYIRNSVKATVDAYDGSVTLYQVDQNDPVLDAWMSVFPGTVQPEEEVSDELRSHFRYPEDLFKVQREMLAKYHVDDPREFFTNNAFWSVPSDPTIDTQANQPPYYVTVGEPETGEPSFNLTSAMVGFNRQFLSAYISAKSDPENYGEITVFQLPTDSQTQGPQQTQNSMISDPRVASERTLLERSNRIQYGNLLTLPIGDGGILYVEPMYTERNSQNQDSSTFPQLSRVLVSYREGPPSNSIRVGYAPTLSEALDQVFGAGTGAAATDPVTDAPAEGGTPAGSEGAAPQPTEPAEPAAPAAPSGDRDSAVAELDSSLAALRQAQQSGDFGAYGAALDRVQRAVAAYEALPR